MFLCFPAGLLPSGGCPAVPGPPRRRPGSVRLRPRPGPEESPAARRHGGGCHEIAPQRFVCLSVWLSVSSFCPLNNNTRRIFKSSPTTFVCLLNNNFCVWKLQWRRARCTCWGKLWSYHFPFVLLFSIAPRGLRCEKVKSRLWWFGSHKENGCTFDVTKRKKKRGKKRRRGKKHGENK